MNDLSGDDRVILKRINGYTMTSIERQVALIQAVRYITRRGIAGCVVECGVWRGGSSMAAALAFAQERDVGRDVFLFDTFEGMTKPMDIDRTIDGMLAQEHLNRDIGRTGVVWAVAGIADVRQNMLSTGYPTENIHFVKGSVEATLPSHSPAGPISLGCDRHSALKFGSTDKIENGFLREIPAFIDFTGWEIQVIQRQSFFMGFMHAFFAFQTQKSLKNMCGMPVTPH